MDGPQTPSGGEVGSEMDMTYNQLQDNSYQAKKMKNNRRRKGRKGSSLPEGVIQNHLRDVQTALKGAWGQYDVFSIPEQPNDKRVLHKIESKSVTHDSSSTWSSRVSFAGFTANNQIEVSITPSNHNKQDSTPLASPVKDGLSRLHPGNKFRLRRVKSNGGSTPGYEISPDIDEWVKYALAKNKKTQYMEAKYTNAAIIIQTHYRSYCLRQQFKLMKRGAIFNRLGSTESVGLTLVANTPSEECPSITEVTSPSVIKPRREAFKTRSMAVTQSERKLRSLPVEETNSIKLEVQDALGEISEEERARLMRLGIHKFNRQAANGLKFLIGKKVIDGSARGIARFIKGATDPANRISTVVVGEYLGENNKFHLEVLDRLIDTMEFTGMSFDVALRHYLSHFTLPGEAQKIDRMMERFAKLYFKFSEPQPNGAKRSGIFKDSDAIYILAYACIMLNTDAHSPHVKHKMTRDDFIRNTRGINGGGDLSRDYLIELFNSIVVTPFMTTDQHTDQVRDICTKLVGLEQTAPMCPPWRYFICEIFGIQISSFVARSPFPHTRRLILFNDLLIIVKQKKKGVQVVKKCVSLCGLKVLSVHSRVHTRAYQLHYGEEAKILGAFTHGPDDKCGTKMLNFMMLMQEFVEEVRYLEETRRDQFLAVDSDEGGSDGKEVVPESFVSLQDSTLPYNEIAVRSTNIPAMANISQLGLIDEIDCSDTSSHISHTSKPSIKLGLSRRNTFSKSSLVDVESVLASTRLPGKKYNLENIPISQRPMSTPLPKEAGALAQRRFIFGDSGAITPNRRHSAHAANMNTHRAAAYAPPSPRSERIYSRKSSKFVWNHTLQSAFRFFHIGCCPSVTEGDASPTILHLEDDMATTTCLEVLSPEMPVNASVE